MAIVEGEGRSQAKEAFHQFLVEQDNAFNGWSPEQWSSVLTQFLQQFAKVEKWQFLTWFNLTTTLSICLHYR